MPNFFKSFFSGKSETPESEKQKNDQKNFEIFKYDGLRAQRMGRPDYAVKCFIEALAIKEEFETMGYLSQLYIQMGETAKARELLEKMAAMEPHLTSTFLTLANVCFIQEDYQALKYGNGYDHNWALNHPAGELSLSAKAEDEKTGRTMEVYTDLPGVQFYTANSLKTEHGKNHAVYTPRCGYCFETQYFPDAINQPEFASPVIKAGEEYKTTTIYKFGVK